MTIQASCVLDRQTIKALTHVAIYKKHRPRMRLTVRLILSAVFISIAVVGFFLQAESALTLLLVSLLLAFVSLSVHFLLPRSQYKALKHMQDVTNRYTFGDDAVTVTTDSDDYNGTCELRYPLFTKVYETSAHFFLYQTANQVFIVDKSTVSGGSEDELRQKLINVTGCQYIRCRY